jgi:uncharacterized protein YjbI with pentapeptide repeats
MKVKGYEIKPQADLRRANLREANLREANLDFSCFPLWCGSFQMIVDDRLIDQLKCHLKRLNVTNCSKENQEFINSIDGNEFCKYRNDIEPV